MLNKTKVLYNNHKIVLENFIYLSFLQIFLLIYPLITYPYLVDVLGKELYGVILTAQMLASYASLFIDFGSNFVCAKHVSINRDNISKLAEILSNVLFVRSIIFVVSFVIFIIITLSVPTYRPYWGIFMLTYGFCTNELLFPQFLFQGLEKMKFISLINVATKIVMLILIFILVKSKEDVFLVPIIYSIGFFLGGAISLFVIVFRLGIKLVKPNLKLSLFYLKDASSIFATDLICTIKDKLSYLLVGTFIGMSEVVIYDLGQKLHGLAAKPYMLICTVMFPRLAQNRSIKQLKLIITVCFTLTILLVVVANLFLKDIVIFFLHEECSLLPLRLFLVGPVILSISYVISNNMFVAFGYNKYMFNSIILTTSIYVISLCMCFALGYMNSIMSFIAIALISYSVELIYRLTKAKQIINIEKSKYIQ